MSTNAKKSKKFQQRELPTWFLPTIVATGALLPLVMLSPKVRSALFLKKERTKHMVTYRSRLTGKARRVVLLRRWSLAQAERWVAVRFIIDTVRNAFSATGTFIVTTSWKEDGRERKEVFEYKAKEFADAADAYLQQVRERAKENEVECMVRIQPRGVTCTIWLVLTPIKKGYTVVSSGMDGDSPALERFVETYLIDEEESK